MPLCATITHTEARRHSCFKWINQFLSNQQTFDTNNKTRISTFIKTVTMHVYDNLVDALKDLKNRGFTTDFNMAFDAVECRHTGVCLSPSQFEIVEHYRFEANTNPDDSSVLYAIESLDGKMKGVLINAYGVYSDAISDSMITKLKVHE